MIKDLLEIELNDTKEIIKYIKNNKSKFINILKDDNAFIDMITDMIQNKEYEKFIKNDSDEEPESEPEPEPQKTGVPEEYFKLKTGEIVYSITSSAGVKLFNSENDIYVGEKIGDYLEGDGQAKVKCFPYDIKQNKLIRSKSEEEILLTGNPVPSASDDDEKKEEKEDTEEEKEEEKEDTEEEEEEEKEEEKEDTEEEEEKEEEIDMTKIKKMQYKKKDYFRIKDQDPAFIYENNNGLIGKKIGKIIMVGTRKKVEFF